MSCRIIPVSGLVLSFLLTSCSVQVDKEPLPIRPDHELLDRKHHYLDKIERFRSDSLPPNIVLILADDLGLHDISTYDPEGVATPAITRLAGKGIRFDAAYASSPVCSPSRAGLLTGRYQQRFGFERQPMNRYPRSRFEYWSVKHFVNTEPMHLLPSMASPDRDELEKQGLPVSEILLSELLKARGYRTGIFGKWHLGLADSFIPNNRGFDEQFGFYEAFSYYYPPGKKGMVEHRHDYFASRHIWRQKRNGSSAIRSNNRVISDTSYLTLSIAERACAFIEDNREQPFFLFLPFSAPHTPFQVPQQYYDRVQDISDHNKRVYAAMIMALDDAIARVLAKLEQLGLNEQTLIIFSSDNGGATYTGATENGPLKAGKFSQFEGGVRVPMILSFPGIIPEGRIVKDPVSQLDILPSCARLAGIALPGDRVYDGIDLIQASLSGDFLSGERPFFWRCDYNRTMRLNQWKLLENTRDNERYLYRLDDDPGEHRNLAEKHPEKVSEFIKLLDAWEQELSEALWPGVMEFRFIIEGDTTLWAI